jgi:large subunit ribosomal protein L15
VNLDRLNELQGDTFDFDTLKQLGVVKKLKGGLKILGTGELTRALTITAHNFSGAAKEKIEAAGGKAMLVGESQGA